MCVCLCVADPRFVGVHQIPESDNPEDDKIYLFFKENAMDGEHAGKATHARIGQLCKVRILTLAHSHTSVQTHAHTSWISQRKIQRLTKGEKQRHTHSHTDIKCEIASVSVKNT